MAHLHPPYHTVAACGMSNPGEDLQKGLTQRSAFWPKLILVLFLAGMGCRRGESPAPADSARVPIQAAGVTATSVPSGSLQSALTGLQKSRETAITRAVRMVSDAVVGINVTSIREYRRSIFDYDPFFQRFFPSRPFRQEVKSLGSGFIIDTEGHVITNEHVVDNAVEITVTLTDGSVHQADIVGMDAITDIALLKMQNPGELRPVKFGQSDDLMIGEWVIALGNPFGLFDLNAKPTVTVGVISATNQSFGRLNKRVYKDMIQTDAAINQGNSGGPLVNALGQVIGVNTFIFTGEGGGGSIGLGFAIPINKVKRIVNELLAHGSVKRTFSLGVEVENMTRLVARFLGLRSNRGVIITEVKKGSPAARTGLKAGDVILAINDQRVNDRSDYEQILVDLDLKEGDTVTLTIYRDGQLAESKLRV